MRATSVAFSADFTLVTEECCRCGVLFAMTEQFRNEALRKTEKFTFYCPNGHPQHFMGKTHEEKLAEAVRAQHAAEARAKLAENAADVERGRTKKAKAKLDRVAKGVCPECNRGFKNLERHMHTKHAAAVST